MTELIRQSPDLCTVSLDINRLEKLSTIVISCNDLDGLVKSEQLASFGEFALLQSDNLEQTLRHPESAMMQLLHTMLTICRRPTRIMLFAHSGCGEGNKSEAIEEFRPQSENENLLTPLEVSVLSRLKVLDRLIQEGLLPGGEKAKIYACLYEAEFDWISVYEPELELFVPLFGQIHI